MPDRRDEIVKNDVIYELQIRNKDVTFNMAATGLANENNQQKVVTLIT